MPHALIVGGTGMLKGVSHYFTRHGYTVSVIGRNQNKFEELIFSKGIHGFINPVKTDYSDYGKLAKKLQNAISIYGPVETAVCWIHSTAPEAPFIIAEILNVQNIKCKFFHVLGSANIQPDGKNEEFENSITKYQNIIYRKVILGFVIEDETSRWLTDTEISNGVTDAIIYDKDDFIVGTLEPWEKRP